MYSIGGLEGLNEARMRRQACEARNLMRSVNASQLVQRPLSCSSNVGCVGAVPEELPVLRNCCGVVHQPAMQMVLRPRLHAVSATCRSDSSDLAVHMLSR